MEQFILENAGPIRLSVFLFLFLLFAIWEMIFPLGPTVLSRSKRWVSNIGLVILNNLFLRLVLPLTAIQFSELVVSKGWGILNLISLDSGLKIILSIVILDFIIYLQHILFHHIPFLWKMHRMHHADLDLDVTSGTRFHPLEILISMGIKFLSIFLIGASPFAVLIFEIVLNGMAMFNHSNISIPKPIDTVLRYLIVTPSLHRIHHSVVVSELNTNFGFNLSIWDRILGTWSSAAKGNLVLGLSNFREEKFSRLDYLLRIPFYRNKNQD